MNSKERVISTINHKKSDRIPLDGWFTKMSWQKLEEYYKNKNNEQILTELGIDFRPVVMEPAPDFRKNAQYLDFIVEGATFSCSDYIQVKAGERLYEDEWGIKIRLNKDGKNWGYAHHPLADFSLKKLKIPDLNAQGRMDKARGIIKKHPDKFIFAGVSTCFRRGWLLTGFSNFLEATITNRSFIEKLLDHLLEFAIKEVAMYVDAGVNMIELLGDLGTEESLFLSPETWREIFKSRMKVLIESVKKKKKDVYFFLHTDGMVESIIPDLIEIGLDILNPIQPECMDPVKIKRLYGDKLVLHGTMSLQKTFSFGTPDDVIAEARSRIKECGYNGGLTLSPSNFFTQDISVENMIAFYNFVKEYKL